MKALKFLMIAALLSLSSFSCEKQDVSPDPEAGTVEINGKLLEQGMTTYQYGTHILSGYALRSSTINLDNYVNQDVTVFGYEISGYPVDGGPIYIEVEQIN